LRAWPGVAERHDLIRTHVNCVADKAGIEL
jgi:hypothetical protein